MTLTIRRAELDDAAALARHMGDPGVYGGLLQMPYPSEAQWRARLERSAAAGGVDLHLVACRQSELIGIGGLVQPSTHERRRHAVSLGLSVAPAAQRQGVGTTLMAALCEYADRWQGVLRIELTVYADNAVAQHLYRKFGFEPEGSLRGYALRDGRYVDAVAMARWHPAPPVRCTPP